jgi:hypothetical protein
VCTWSELLAGAEPHQLDGMRALMCQFIILDLNVQIAELAATLRRDIFFGAFVGASNRKLRCRARFLSMTNRFSTNPTASAKMQSQEINSSLVFGAQ